MLFRGVKHFKMKVEELFPGAYYRKSGHNDINAYSKEDDCIGTYNYSQRKGNINGLGEWHENFYPE